MNHENSNPSCCCKFFRPTDHVVTFSFHNFEKTVKYHKMEDEEYELSDLDALVEDVDPGTVADLAVEKHRKRKLDKSKSRDEYNRRSFGEDELTTEAASEMNEFNVTLTSTSAPSLTLENVAAAISGKDAKGKEKKKSKVLDILLHPKTKVQLAKPLEKPAEQRIQRSVLYENVTKDVSKWNSVVYHNRAADQLIFPLNEAKKLPRKAAVKEAATEFTPETELEEEMARILHGAEYVKKKKEEIHGKDGMGKTEADAYVMGIEEALEQHHEMARLRALQSYEQIKAKRQSKIKSKKYHRLLRREKIRKQLKEFEQLQRTDPEAALLKLEELDKSRVQERMSLKHRNTSKWAKMHSARAKYDRESRSALSEQLKISRELTKKVGMDSSEDEDEMDDDIVTDLPNLVKSSLTNPWILDPAVKDNEKIQLYYPGYKKFWQELNEKKEKERLKEEKAEQEKLEAKSKAKETKTNKKLKNKKSVPELAEPDKKTSETTPVPNATQGKIKEKKKKTKKSTKSIQLESQNEMPEFDLGNGEVSFELLDQIFDAAEENMKGNALKTLRKLEKVKGQEEKRKQKQVNKDKVKRKKGKTIVTKSEGDAGEVVDLNVDDSIRINEGNEEDSDQNPNKKSRIDLLSVREEEVKNFAQKLRQPTTPAKKAPVIIDTSNFLKISANPTYDMEGMNEENDKLNSEDAEMEKLKIIAEAFEDDELLEEFKRRKQEEVEAQMPKDVNLHLPGWGDWGGKDLKPNLKKQRRFLKRAPPPPPRKDALTSHVILNDDANSKLKEHQVRSLPFPFKRVQDFEKIIRAPVGRTWLPEPALKSLIAPKVITRLGAVIEPISEEALVSKAQLKGQAQKPGLTGLKLTEKRRPRSRPAIKT